MIPRIDTCLRTDPLMVYAEIRSKTEAYLKTSAGTLGKRHFLFARVFEQESCGKETLNSSCELLSLTLGVEAKG